MARIIGDPSRDLGVKLCHALGVDATDVFGIEIRCFVGEAANVRISKYILDTEMNHLIDEVATYKLVIIE